MARLDDLLARCLMELEANDGDIEACLRRYPDQADALRPYLALSAGLRDGAAAVPQAALADGREKLVQAAIDRNSGSKEEERMWKNPVYRLATAMSGALLLGVAVMGIAGATGGGGPGGFLHAQSNQAGADTPTPTPTGGPGETATPTPTSGTGETPTPGPELTPTPTPTPGGQVNGDDNHEGNNEDHENDDEHPEASPGPRTEAENPGGHCVMLPNTSDVIRHPEKHPNWHVGSEDCAATPTPEATPTPGTEETPTPTPATEATPTPAVGQGQEGDDHSHNEGTEDLGRNTNMPVMNHTHGHGHGHDD